MNEGYSTVNLKAELAAAKANVRHAYERFIATRHRGNGIEDRVGHNAVMELDYYVGHIELIDEHLSTKSPEVEWYAHWDWYSELHLLDCDCELEDWQMATRKRLQEHNKQLGGVK